MWLVANQIRDLSSNDDAVVLRRLYTFNNQTRFAMLPMADETI